jgi:ATP-binding cassette subfamily C protein
MTYHWILQHSGEDCAAASLAIVTQHYGRSLRINQIRDRVGTGAGGTTMLGLKRGAEALGFETQAIKASPDILQELDTLTLPAILFWQGYHFVVFYGKKGNRYVLSDPAIGVRYITRQELLKGWQGCLMLLLKPDPARFAAQPEDTEPLNPFERLLHRLWQHRRILRGLLPLNLAVGILALATPLLLQFLIDQVLTPGNTNWLMPVALGVMALTLLNSALTWAQSNLVAAFAERLQQSLKLDFGQQVLHLPLTYHEARRSGTAIHRLADIQQINQVVSQLVIELPIKAVVGLVALGLIWVYSWPLGLLTVGLGAAMMITTLVFQPAIRQATHRACVTAGENAGVLSEAFNGALTLKMMAAAPQLYPEIQQRSNQESNHNLRAARTRIANTTIAEAIASIGTVLLLWLGSSLVFQGQLTIGTLIAIYGLKEGVLQFAIATVKLLSDWSEIKAITRLLAELFEYTPENQGDAAKPWIPLPAAPDIHVKNLTFHYPGRRTLIENLSMQIPGGQVVALIGKSGCGKSTLAKLITGLYPLQSGEIWLGDYPLPDLPLDCLRQQVTLVPQDAFFLHRSIIENLRLAAPNATRQDIITVCQIAGADEFVRQMPQQYDTVLGVVGANISGGQKQRLAIARALLNHPPILILDESTANLDPLTETDVLDRVLAYRQGQTTILISHRPQVIQYADWIVMLDQGHLQFSGNRQDFHAGSHLADAFLHQAVPA